MKITVVGTGYVGLSLAVLLAQKYEVTAVDVVPEKVDLINSCKSPIKDEYIEKYLFKEECADLSDFDINKHDLNTLCNIVNTGVCLRSDNDVVLKELLKGILGVYTSKRTRHRSSDILDFMSAMKVSSYLGDVLFENSTRRAGFTDTAQPRRIRGKLHFLSHE